MTQDLTGRAVLITGAGRGIGEAIALRFAAEGACLHLASRTESELRQVQNRCRSAGAECSTHVADVGDLEEVRGLVKKAGAIDVLVNCAGVLGPVGPMVGNDVDEWARCLQVNLMGTLYTCREAIPAMVERGHGSVVNLSGGGAVSPRANFSSYAVSKAAVVRLTETLALELAGTGVRVNAIAPGPVDTRIQDGVLAAGERAGVDYKAARSMRDTGDGAVSPAVAADLALYLASDASAALTGKLISAVHDPWRHWDAAQVGSLTDTGWYTMRRLDPFTVGRLGGRP